MLYRFRIELSDMDRSRYETLDFRTALHPSESPISLVTRALAFALNSQEGLEFSPGGLSDPDAPALHIPNPHGGARLWIEIGNPSARKLHKASKACNEVKVYTYKNPELLLKEIASAHIHRVEELQIFSFDPRFLDRLVEGLDRENRWNVMHAEGSLIVSWGIDRVEQSELRSHKVTPHEK